MQEEFESVNKWELSLAAVYRWSYLVATYSGFRAIANRVRSRFRHRACRLAQLHRSVLSSEQLGQLALSVHSRQRPPSGARRAEYGMISVRQRRPRIGRPLYWYFCLTSHFGSGHVEIAFYRRGRRITFYAVRNVARSNASRLGLTGIADDLLLGRRDGEARLAMELARLLGDHGFVTSFACPDECVRLSVCPRLLRPGSQWEALGALRRKYERLHGSFAPREAR